MGTILFIIPNWKLVVFPCQSIDGRFIPRHAATRMENKKGLELSTEVSIPGDTVKFPSRCVVCGADLDTGDTVTLRGNPVGFNGVIPWLLRRTKLLAVPAHAHCGAPLARQLLRRNLMPIALITIVIIVAVIFLNVPKWPTIAICVALLIFHGLWEVCHPPAFEFTHRWSRFKLSFRDPDYARDVAAINDGAVLEGDTNEDDDEEDTPAQ